MAQWKNVDSAAGAPKFEFTKKSKTGTQLYGNTTPGAFTPDQVEGVFGIDKGEMVNSVGITAAGWIHARWGTGPVVGIAVNPAGSTGYANTNLVKVSGGSVNASATLVTNATGGIVSVALVTPGRGFSNVSVSAVAVTNSTGGTTGVGTGGTFTITLGGRAGRKAFSTLVAMRSMTANGSGGI